MGRGRPNSDTSYCPNCGEELSATANFCPNCGERNDHGPDRGSISDRDVLEYRITKAMEAGWKLEHDFGDHAVMIRRDLGSAGTHFLIALLTFWWSMGMGNALYAAYRHFAAPERIVLRAEQVDSDRARSPSEGDSASLSWWGAGLTALVLWFGAAVAAAIAGAVSSLVWTIPFVLAAALFALGGVGVLPPVKRRLERRRSTASNGWVRSVDERSVVDPDEPCVSCASPIRRGVERTYRKEFCLLGVPLSTAEGGTNYYCRQCANDDRSSVDPVRIPDEGRSMRAANDGEPASESSADDRDTLESERESD